MQPGMMRVYAIEKNPEGVQKTVVKIDHASGDRRECSEGIRRFRGADSCIYWWKLGLKEILQCVKAKNVKIVMTCISLNTMAEVMKAIESGDLRDPEIVQISVAKSKQVAHHHMMTGQNPIYCFGGSNVKIPRILIAAA